MNDFLFAFLDIIHITSHIFLSLFLLIASVVRVKMFHINKITCKLYTGASPRRTICRIAVVRLKIHHPVYSPNYVGNSMYMWRSLEKGTTSSAGPFCN